VAQQRDNTLGGHAGGEHLHWVHKEASKERTWSPMQHRCMLLGLLFDVDESILRPAAASRDQMLLYAIWMALKNLIDLELVHAVALKQIACFSLDLEEYRGGCHQPTDSICISARASCLAAIFSRSFAAADDNLASCFAGATALAWRASYAERAVESLLGVLHEERRNERFDEHSAPVIHVVLWALDEILAGSTCPREWGERICDHAELAYHNFKDLPRSRCLDALEQAGVMLAKFHSSRSLPNEVHEVWGS